MKRELIAFLLLNMGIMSQAASWFVTPDGTGNGKSWASSGSIQTILPNANEEDILYLSEGNYTIGEPLTVHKSIQLQGGYQKDDEVQVVLPDPLAHPTILTTQTVSTSSSITLCLLGSTIESSSPIVLNGLTFKNHNYSGGIGGTLTLISGNKRSIVLQECRFEACRSSHPSEGNGGALYVFANGNPFRLLIENCLFSGCSATKHGGAIYLGSNLSEVMIRNCEFSDNQSGGNGGAIISNSGHTVEVEACCFLSNSAGRQADLAGSGGAILLGSKENYTFTNCYFFDNLATQKGGALFAGGTQTAISPVIRFTDCVVTGNRSIRSTDLRCALDTDNLIYNGFQFENSIVSNNTTRPNGGTVRRDLIIFGSLPSESLLTNSILNGRYIAHGSIASTFTVGAAYNDFLSTQDYSALLANTTTREELLRSAPSSIECPTIATTEQPFYQEGKTIRFSQSTKQLLLFSIGGELLQIHSEPQVVSLESLPKGIYLLRTEKGTWRLHLGI